MAISQEGALKYRYAAPTDWLAAGIHLINNITLQGPANDSRIKNMTLRTVGIKVDVSHENETLRHQLNIGV